MGICICEPRKGKPRKCRAVRCTESGDLYCARARAVEAAMIAGVKSAAEAAEAVEATVAIDAADPVAFLRSLHAAGGTIAWSRPERGPVES